MTAYFDDKDNEENTNTPVKIVDYFSIKSQFQLRNILT